MTILAEPAVLRFLGVKGAPRARQRQPVPAPVITFGAVRALKERLQLDDNAASRLAGMPPRTYQRRKAADAELSAAEADATLRSARIVQQAIGVFGDQTRAVAWLKRASPLLGGVPLEMVSSDAGAKAVADELTRIHMGDYA